MHRERENIFCNTQKTFRLSVLNLRCYNKIFLLHNTSKVLYDLDVHRLIKKQVRIQVSLDTEDRITDMCCKCQMVDSQISFSRNRNKNISNIILSLFTFSVSIIYPSKQQSELLEEVKALKRQLEQVGEKKNSLQAQLEQRTDEEIKTKNLLEEKVTKVHLLKQETRQVLLTVVFLGVLSVFERELLWKNVSFKGETLVKHDLLSI